MGRKRGSQRQSSLMADSFSTFFSDKVNDVRVPTAGSADPEFTAFHVHSLDEFIPLSVADVVCLVKDSPTNACGLYPVLTWLVKDFMQLLAPYLTNLYNRSLSQGHFPEMFCLAEVTPILKKFTLDPSMLSSYRPISSPARKSIRVPMQPLDGNRSPEGDPEDADRGNLTLHGMLDLSAALIVWIKASSSTDSRHRLDSPDWYSTGWDHTSSEGGSIWDTMGLHPQ